MVLSLGPVICGMCAGGEVMTSFGAGYEIARKPHSKIWHHSHEAGAVAFVFVVNQYYKSQVYFVNGNQYFWHHVLGV